MNPEDIKGVSLRDLVDVLRRWWWLIAAAVAICVIVAGAYAYTRTPRYAATATLLFIGHTDVSAVMTGLQTSGASTMEIDRELSTAAELVGSNEMRARVAQASGDSSLGPSIAAAPVTDTNVLMITASSTDPHKAASAANAYAAAFIQWRLDDAVAKIREAERIVEGKLKAYSTPAARTSSAYYFLLQQLQNLKVLEALQTGSYEITQPAVVPQRPVYPRTRRTLLIGLLAGVILGIVAAFAAEQLDVRVRDQDDMVEALSMPVLGRVPEVPRAVVRTGALTVVAEPDGLSAEAFRILRGNLDFVNVDRKVRSILVTSCTSGEGKSSTVSNLAVMLTRSGRSVAVVECDLRRPKIHRYFGLPNDRGLSDVLTGRLTLEEALQTVTAENGGIAGDGDGSKKAKSEGSATSRAKLDVLTSGSLPPNPGEIVLTDRLARTIHDLGSGHDVVLVDSPPFLAIGDAASLATHVDGVVVVMKIGHVTKAMLRDAREFLRTVPCAKLGIVVTNASQEARGVYRHRYYARPIGDLGESRVAAAAGETTDDAVAAATGDEVDEAEPITTT